METNGFSGRHPATGRGPFAMMSRPARDRLLVAVLSGAMLIAPFVALLYGVEAGLAAMAAALGAVSCLVWQRLPTVGMETRRWLHVSLVVNVSLAAACVALLGWLLLIR